MSTTTLPVHLPSSPAADLPAGPSSAFALRFDGVTYEPDRDGSRLFAQLARVRAAMVGAGPLTLAQISALTGDPQASASARLRDLRKARFGGHTVRRTYAGNGLHRYELVT